VEPEKFPYDADLLDQIFEKKDPQYFKYLFCNTEITPIIIREVLRPPDEAPFRVKNLIDAALLMITTKEYEKAYKNFEEG